MLNDREIIPELEIPEDRGDLSSILKTDDIDDTRSQRSLLDTT
jgi:hypothetical protein